MTGSHMLYLMRHGAPVREGLLLGRTDDSVTEAGVAACVQRAAGLEVAAIVSSDLKRTRDCATAIGSVRGIVGAADRRWRELDFGAWDGMRPAIRRAGGCRDRLVRPEAYTRLRDGDRQRAGHRRRGRSTVA